MFDVKLLLFLSASPYLSYVSSTIFPLQVNRIKWSGGSGLVPQWSMSFKHKLYISTSLVFVFYPGRALHGEGQTRVDDVLLRRSLQQHGTLSEEEDEEEEHLLRSEHVSTHGDPSLELGGGDDGDGAAVFSELPFQTLLDWHWGEDGASKMEDGGPERSFYRTGTIERFQFRACSKWFNINTRTDTFDTVTWAILYSRTYGII